MQISRQQYYSRLPFPSPGDLSDPGIEPLSVASPALAGGFFTSWATREWTYISSLKKWLIAGLVMGMYKMGLKPLCQWKKRLMGIHQKPHRPHSIPTPHSSLLWNNSYGVAEIFISLWKVPLKRKLRVSTSHRDQKEDKGSKLESRYVVSCQKRWTDPPHTLVRRKSKLRNYFGQYSHPPVSTGYWFQDPQGWKNLPYSSPLC